MQRRAASYPSSYVVDSLCCVSRASLLTGQYPHQTGVRTNTANLPNPEGPVGGFAAFREYGNGPRAVNVRLQEAGYATGYVGKFLNEYEPRLLGGTMPVPEGWTSWNVLFGNAYDGWDFDSSEVVDGQLPAPPPPRPRVRRRLGRPGVALADGRAAGEDSDQGPSRPRTDAAVGRPDGRADPRDRRRGHRGRLHQ